MTWLIPAGVTAFSLAAAWLLTPERRGDYDLGPALGCMFYPAAGCVSLAAWLAWALL